MEIECPPNCLKNYVHVADIHNGVYSVNSSVCAAAFRENITGTINMICELLRFIQHHKL